MRGACEAKACLKVGYFSRGGRVFHAVFDAAKGKFVKFGIGKLKLKREKSLDKFAKRIADGFGGKGCSIPGSMLDFSELGDFEKRVLLAVAKVKKGETLTYGEIAREAGSPKAARAVGSVMRKNPFPFAIPCHRVVRGDGLGRYGFGKRAKSGILRREAAKVSF